MDPLEQYLSERYWSEDDLLREVRADTARRGPSIQVSDEAGRLLALLVRALGATRVLEVGTLFGYSGIWMARQLPPGGRLDTIELSAQLENAHRDIKEMGASLAEARLMAKNAERRAGITVRAVDHLPVPILVEASQQKEAADSPSGSDFCKGIVDAMRENGNLDLRRAGVVGLGRALFDDSGLRRTPVRCDLRHRKLLSNWRGC